MALIDCGEYEDAFNDDDREVDVARNVAHRRIRLQAFDDAALGGHGVNFPSEAVFNEALQKVAADGVGLGGRTDHGDGAGFHDAVENRHKKPREMEKAGTKGRRRTGTQINRPAIY